MDDPASLQNMNDIVEPAAIGLWPLAPGVWLVVALVMLWAVVGVVTLWFRFRQNAYRRAGLRELGNIRLRMDTPDGRQLAVQELSALLKRVALTAFPRKEVAALSGEDWLAFLDASSGGGWFSSYPGSLLGESVYRSSKFSMKVSVRQMNDLFRLAEKWIQRHRPAQPDARHPPGRNSLDLGFTSQR
jgi:hypothetical protein